jgi:hypothetical protein
MPNFANLYDHARLHGAKIGIFPEIIGIHPWKFADF